MQSTNNCANVPKYKSVINGVIFCDSRFTQNVSQSYQKISDCSLTFVFITNKILNHDLILFRILGKLLINWTTIRKCHFVNNLQTKTRYKDHSITYKWFLFHIWIYKKILLTYFKYGKLANKVIEY